MKKLILPSIALLAVLFTGLPVLAVWQPLASEQPIAPEVLIGSDKSGVLTLTWELPGCDLTEVLVEGQLYTQVSLPGAYPLQEQGYPELPSLTTTLSVPDQGKLELRIVEHTEVVWSVAKVLPSHGHLSRQVDPAQVPRRTGPIYETGGIWPGRLAHQEGPFIWREVRGVTVRVNPFRYDAGQGVLLVTTRLVLELVATAEPGLNELSLPTPGAAADPFEGVYTRVLANSPVTSSSLKYDPLVQKPRMLIVCDDDLTSTLDPFLQWKARRGIAVELVTVSAVGGTASGIKQAIAERYASSDGLTYVILVGDLAQVPTNSGTFEGADADGMYAMLLGDDLYPEVCVSRISARNSSELATQINKFIAYERDPDRGVAGLWYCQATGIASDEGTPSDSERAELLKNDLLSAGFLSVDAIYEGQGGTTAQITTALTEGRSLVNYIGHGTGTAWTSVSYAVANVLALDNDRHWPWVVDVSCSNGDFSLDTCFAEAWLRAGTPEEPRGAVGMMSASSDAPWVPPTLMQAEVVDLVAAGNEFCLGALYYSGLMKVLDIYAGLPVATEVMEQNNIFGDCSLQIRSVPPTDFVVAHPGAVGVDARSLAVEVFGPVGSVVAVTTGSLLLGSTVVTEGGALQVDLLAIPAGKETLQLTVSGRNMVPYQSDLGVAPAGTPVLVEEIPCAVVLLGNFPNPFNPRTRIVFELPQGQNVRVKVYDLAGHQIRQLVDGWLAAGRQELAWDGLDQEGRPIASGVYFYRLETAEGLLSGRMLLAR